MQNIIVIKNGVTRMPVWRMAEPVNFTSCQGEQLAIVGPNGGGKSMLVDIIIGRHPLLMSDPEYDFSPSRKQLVSDNIKYITFRDAYGGDNDKTYYLQQRWNQMEINSDTPTVASTLAEAYRLSGQDTEEHRQLRDTLYAMFNIDKMMDKYIILLSSGELRKLKLTEALLSSPRVLIMDNPFIGLDKETRQQLKDLLTMLSQKQNLQIILVLSRAIDIPEFITHVVEVNNMRVLPKVTRQEYLNRVAQHGNAEPVLSASAHDAILSLPVRKAGSELHEIVKMNNVSIRYGKRTILKDLNWTISNGEHWSLSGPNGAGKSTLLSLVCADNPQSYACDIALFGKARGTGESIWDIKKHIGYVSPEMHRAYQRDMPAIRIVASGLADNVGLYVKPKESEYDVCRFWMDIFGLKGLEERTFLKLSSGEQRLVLLARAFVKDPELLILDEPLHGLDAHNRELVKEVIDTFCQRPDKTLIMVTHYQEDLPTCIDHALQLVKQK